MYNDNSDNSADIGNILSIITHPYTAPYDEPSNNGSVNTLQYNDASNPDHLTKYGYSNIGYNAIGYPVTYGNKHLDWSHGKLTKYYEEEDPAGISSSESTEFSYNAFGQRVRKEYSYYPGVDYSGDFTIGKEVSYDYDHSGRLIREVSTEYFTESASVTQELMFLYDESGMIGFTHSRNGATPQAYYYHRNLQGDVVAIYNTSGTKVAGYAYDAWGNCIINYSVNGGIAQINPIRYRGYYWDSETKWYFLNARYYSPEWRRFISPDDTSYLDPESVNGLNLYCYCNNDPVNYCDPSGHFAFFLLTALLAVGTVAAIDYIPDQEFDLHWGWYVGAAVVGAAIGLGISYYATGSAFSSVGKVFSGLFGKTTYYRTMSVDDYATLQSTGKLPAGTETFITPNASYASGYHGLTVKFTVRNRTVNWLTKIGVRDTSTILSSMYPSMPIVSKGWMATNAYFKLEQGIINIGLGYGKALDIFNKGILMFGLI